MKLLLDANLSPETAAYLRRRFGFDVIDLISQKLHGLPDAKVVELAKAQQRVIITFDRGFGETYYAHERGAIGVIVLRLKDQAVKTVNSDSRAFLCSTCSAH
ncbi:MAG: DUF5615 family PIN-like protein [Chloroflexi bacterium]|nr:DUF5615 family PIN-like protein [Chloroflexota bacterium]